MSRLMSFPWRPAMWVGVMAVGVALSASVGAQSSGKVAGSSAANDAPSARAVGADPTRPPMMGMGMPPATPPAGGASSGMYAPTAFQLQGVQVPQRGKPSALISGDTYFVGDRVGGYEIVRIDGRGVTLRGQNGSEQWLLSDSELPYAKLENAVRAEPASAARATPRN